MKNNNYQYITENDMMDNININTYEDYDYRYDDMIPTHHNHGHSSRLSYDDMTYQDKIKESVGPLHYRLDHNRIHNCDHCLSTFGPRSSYMGHGVSMVVDNEPAVSQSPHMVNIESILTNRNTFASKNKKNQINPINVTKFKLKHPRICNNNLNPLSSRLSYPTANYREMGLNRFHDLNKPIQRVIFWDSSINTKLDAKDNFVPQIPKIWSTGPTIPHEKITKKKCKTIKICPVGDNSIDY